MGSGDILSFDLLLLLLLDVRDLRGFFFLLGIVLIIFLLDKVKFYWFVFVMFIVGKIFVLCGMELFFFFYFGYVWDYFDELVEGIKFLWNFIVGVESCC